MRRAVLQFIRPSPQPHTLSAVYTHQWGRSGRYPCRPQSVLLPDTEPGVCTEVCSFTSHTHPRVCHAVTLARCPLAKLSLPGPDTSKLGCERDSLLLAMVRGRHNRGTDPITHPTYAYFCYHRGESQIPT